MKSLHLKIRQRSAIARALVLALFFWGIGPLAGVSLLYAAIAPAHPVFVSEDNHTLRLTFHHPGNRDQHEKYLKASLAHRHDLFDRMLSVSHPAAADYQDHVIEIPAFEAQDSVTSKIMVVGGVALVIPQASSLVMYSDLVRLRHVPLSTVSPLFKTFLSTILII